MRPRVRSALLGDSGEGCSIKVNMFISINSEAFCQGVFCLACDSCWRVSLRLRRQSGTEFLFAGQPRHNACVVERMKVYSSHLSLVVSGHRPGAEVASERVGEIVDATCQPMFCRRSQAASNTHAASRASW